MRINIKYKWIFKNSWKMNGKFYVSDWETYIFLWEENYVDNFEIWKDYNFLIDASRWNYNKTYCVWKNDENNNFDENNVNNENINDNIQKLYDKKIKELEDKINNINILLIKLWNLNWINIFDLLDENINVTWIITEEKENDEIKYEKVNFFDESKQPNFFDDN